MKEKYNYVAKEVLECKLKQDQTRASDFDNSKEVKQKNQNDPQVSFNKNNSFKCHFFRFNRLNS